MQLGFESQIPDGLLAANALLAENSRQGFGAWSGTVHQGFGVVISHTALGIKGSLYDGGIGSRCTGKERDVETGLDYFEARYYGSLYGRFSSPDPSGLASSNLSDPQSFNLYSYVRNNPLINIDPTGLDCVYLNANGGGIDPNGIDHHSDTESCWSTGGYWAPGFVSGASDVHTSPGSDLIGIGSTTNGQGLFSIANCATCSTIGSNGSPLGAYTQTVGEVSLNEPGIIANMVSTLPANYSPGGTVVKGYTPPPTQHYSQSQLIGLCAIGASLQGGMTVPAGSAAAGDPSNDPAQETVQIPGKATYEKSNQIPGQTMQGGRYAPISNPGTGAALGGLFSLGGTTAQCVGAANGIR